METRKETLNALKLCRFCLSQDETLTSLYDRSRAPKNSVPLPLKILSCVSIEVFPSDRMPSFICNRCKFFMDISYDYKQMCRQADENVLQYIQSGTDIKSVPWPQSLQKLFRVATKAAPELAVMKTVVQGGATVQVTAQESDSEEEDDENVYNIKIGDGSNDGPKNARVKVITADKTSKMKPKQDKDAEDKGRPIIQPRPSTDSWELPRTPMAIEVAARATETREYWPCDECDCTYTLEQLLTLHKKNKHKPRNVKCDECDAKFFNPYDLAAHRLRHVPDSFNFQCVACGKGFIRSVQLKRHEKSVHANLERIPCQSCPATFLSQEQLDEHSQKHLKCAKKRKFPCDKCDKRFYDKSTLERHKTNMHDKDDEFGCIYCPARFASVTKLTRHVHTHEGERSYPCKYCNKSFVKSHHYTRHLRLKHRETNRTCRGPFGESIDQYRCEECEDTFETQDDLIFHSAIHATQNLICPLCQEKFADVDAVTVHVKSHVNGMEFMCELCELIFTSKDKLEGHMNIAHEYELQNDENDESSMEMEVEDDEDDTGMQVKEEDGHMVVEIKKADDFMLTSTQAEPDYKIGNANSEESEPESSSDLPTVDTLAMTKKDLVKTTSEKISTATPGGAIITKGVSTPPPKTIDKAENQSASILRRADEVKRKAQADPVPEKKNNKSEGNNTGASDKSLRLLEKELQELKRTNTRSEAVKTPVKPMETLRNRRPQIHTSTPKIKPAVVEEKKTPSVTKSPALEKKQPEKRLLTKENKEPKELKESKGNNGNSNVIVKEDKEKEIKETSKNVIKNGSSDKSQEGEGIRRSTRPSKIKDYAKMIRDRSQGSDEDDDSDEVDEEYKETDRSIESKAKGRRMSIKPSPKPAPAPPAGAPGGTPAPRKRGRPRKDAGVTPAKLKKDDDAEEVKPEEPIKESRAEVDKANKAKENSQPPVESEKPKEKPIVDYNEDSESKSASDGKPTSDATESPTGQTLKKVSSLTDLKKIPIKALPLGIKPMPLPGTPRAMGTGEVCEMQIGKKVVKVQKIVMTKAEVEAMAKKGLVEMKDGTMVLKQGIKIPTSDHSPLKPLVGDEKESPSKIDKATPTRCEIDEEF